VKKLRLLLFPDCDRNCNGCCNRDWDLDALPMCRDFSPYDEVLLTGGEPMLHPNLVHRAIRQIRRTSDADVYLYTANVIRNHRTHDVLAAADGICVTLHEQCDVRPWLRFAFTSQELTAYRSCRLHVFAGVKLPRVLPADWQIKEGLEWQPDCPLPEGEVFMRWEQ